ncbi:MAG: sulfatase family protein, partial [Bryobacteraceae bacterium]
MADLTRRRFLAASGALAPGVRASRRPNILFVFPDQMRAQALGAMGNPDVRTPQLDRLASQGVLFENTLANSPVCSPARATMLTGKYAHRNGMIANDLRLRESEVTLAEILADAGYHTGFIGKWHLDGGPRLPGFVPPGPRRQGFRFWAANECSHRHFDNTYFRDDPQPIRTNRFEPEVWTDLAIEFLQASARSRQPFFLMIAMGPPHDPYGAPEQYMKMYDPARLAMRHNWKARPGSPGPKEIAAYYAAITAIDDQIGRLLAALDRLGMAEDTIVWFTSDHGDMLGSHGLRLKRKPFEESIRVPGILRWPARVRAGRRERTLFTHVDFAPTLLALSGLKAPRAMQGADLSRVILEGNPRAPASAYFQIFGPYAPGEVPAGWRGVRTQRFMYARFADRPWVLFDLEKDPYELNNLVDDPAAAGIRQEMEALLARWMRRTGDAWSYNWTVPVEEGGRLYRERAFYSVQEYLEWARGREGR